MLISESQKRGEIHKLLSQTHSSGVHYSLFIMETVEKSSEKMNTTPTVPRWSFPPPICSSRSLFWCFSVYGRLRLENFGGLFIQSFLGQDEASGRRINANGASRPKTPGPTRLGNLAAWAYVFWPSGLHSFASFAHTPSSFQKLMPSNFQVILTSFGSLKHQNIENRVFCQCRVNSRKIGKL